MDFKITLGILNSYKRTGVEKSNNTKRSKVTNESSCLLLTIGNRNLQTNYFLPNYKVLTISIIF